METPEPPPFSRKKIVVVAAFLVLCSVGVLVAACCLRRSEGYWETKLVTAGIGGIVIFGIALVQGLVILFTPDDGKKKRDDRAP